MYKLYRNLKGVLVIVVLLGLSKNLYVTNTSVYAMEGECIGGNCICGDRGFAEYEELQNEATNKEDLIRREHEYKVVDVIEPTCEKQGKITYRCIWCYEATYFEIFEQTGHVEGEWEIIKEATLFELGERVLRCEEDGVILEAEQFESGYQPIFYVGICLVGCVIFGWIGARIGIKEREGKS